MSRIDIKKEVERLLKFGLRSGLLEELDIIPARNALLDLLRIDEPYGGDDACEPPDSPAEILRGILDYAADAGILPENNTTYRDLLDAKIMGLLMPRQSEVARRFWKTAEERSIEEATDDFYRLSIHSNYIRMDRIQKNEYWQTETEYGKLEITINLSKPEKDPKEIAAERSAPQSRYPKCLLCVENVGYAGRINHPARQNHRVIPLELDGSRWFFQYSPYVYYNEHCIVLSEEHTPMKISGQTFVRLLDFVARFPHYFIGSNADLPIVGGSILSHDHFQGGKHRFPMELAPVEQTFTHPRYRGVKTGIVKWPMSVIRISGGDRQELAQLAANILEGWRAYSDPSADILAYSTQDGNRVPHNTITPIARMNVNGEYELDLVLRNNRTDERHPDGIFHPHQELHHVKKENIGLIEVMGLAVLPGRLQTELELIKRILTGQTAYSAEIRKQTDHPLHKHAEWIERLIAKYGTAMTWEAADQTMKTETGNKFLQVLADAGVYKRNEAGMAAFCDFMRHMGFRHD